MQNERNVSRATRPSTRSGFSSCFFQAEDGIRDHCVTGVQTCALPIFNKIASDLSLKQPQFQTCLNSEAARAVVLRDVQEAKRLGINSTPTFIINGKLVRGAIDRKSVV